MAILNEIEVSIQVNGVDLQEYEDPHGSITKHNEISRYVGSISGALFTIKHGVSKTFDMTTNCLSFEFLLDGDMRRNITLTKEQFDNYKSDSYSSIIGIPIHDKNGSRLQHFEFGKINIVEPADDELLDTPDNQRLSEMGTICCKSAPPGPHHISLPSPRVKEEIKIEQSRHIEAEKVELEPIAVFTFKYRSKEALQTLQILPQAPSNLPDESNDDVVETTKTEFESKKGGRVQSPLLYRRSRLT
ncbi:uncharacterized protein KY384_003346 [Bacidia gigantensis]|uniref:uncharacterized protein n=1 Tax=Bacidia gigantensis TaxID=2732470 RepID=UPI001D03A93A|nr:uncharacterized protein KY384_003346 [Bacidia gigantensis]KAG8531714.1 hypothetical protein KY384_003346 [Bacidia gigantensis]